VNKALAKMLAGINAGGLKLPKHYPEKQVVDAKLITHYGEAIKPVLSALKPE